MLSDRRSNRTLVLLFLYNSYIQCCRNFRAAGVCSNKAIVPADLQLSCKREQKQIIFWLCRAQPTINKINLPEYNIRIFQSAMLPALYSKKAFGFNSFNYSNFFNSLINNS